MAADGMEEEELRFCFDIDVSEDEFYQSLDPKVGFVVCTCNVNPPTTHPPGNFFVKLRVSYWFTLG